MLIGHTSNCEHTQFTFDFFIVCSLCPSIPFVNIEIICHKLFRYDFHISDSVVRKWNETHQQRQHIECAVCLWQSLISLLEIDGALIDSCVYACACDK